MLEEKLLRHVNRHVVQISIGETSHLLVTSLVMFTAIDLIEEPAGTHEHTMQLPGQIVEVGKEEIYMIHHIVPYVNLHFQARLRDIDMLICSMSMIADPNINLTIGPQLRL